MKSNRRGSSKVSDNVKSLRPSVNLETLEITPNTINRQTTETTSGRFFFGGS